MIVSLGCLSFYACLVSSIIGYDNDDDDGDDECPHYNKHNLGCQHFPLFHTRMHLPFSIEPTYITCIFIFVLYNIHGRYSLYDEHWSFCLFRFGYFDVFGKCWLVGRSGGLSDHHYMYANICTCIKYKYIYIVVQSISCYQLVAGKWLFRLTTPDWCAVVCRRSLAACLYHLYIIHCTYICIWTYKHDLRSGDGTFIRHYHKWLSYILWLAAPNHHFILCLPIDHHCQHNLHTIDLILMVGSGFNVRLFVIDHYTVVIQNSNWPTDIQYLTDSSTSFCCLIRSPILLCPYFICWWLHSYQLTRFADSIPFVWQHDHSWLRPKTSQLIIERLSTIEIKTNWSFKGR